MKKLPLVLLMVLGLASMIAITGCESDDDDDGDNGGSAMSISPNDVSFTAPLVTNILFTVSGGVAPYSWSLDTPTLGTIVSSGVTAIYTSTTGSGINYLLVTDASSNAVTVAIRQL